MYERGKGVPKDYPEAVKWFRKAPDQGYAKAQFDLGFVYSNGRGVVKDYVLALSWFNLAEAQGLKLADEYRDSVEKKMTPAGISKAQKLAREWMAKHRKK